MVLAARGARHRARRLRGTARPGDRRLHHVMTSLKTLEQKGTSTTTQQDRAHLYRPARPKQQVRQGDGARLRRPRLQRVGPVAAARGTCSRTIRSPSPSSGRSPGRWRSGDQRPPADRQCPVVRPAGRGARRPPWRWLASAFQLELVAPVAHRPRPLAHAAAGLPGAAVLSARNIIVPPGSRRKRLTTLASVAPATLHAGAPVVPRPAAWPTATVGIAVLAAGVGLRLAWLMLGASSLRRLRRDGCARSIRSPPACTRRRRGSASRRRSSRPIASPVALPSAGAVRSCCFLPASRRCRRTSRKRSPITGSAPPPPPRLALRIVRGVCPDHPSGSIPRSGGWSAASGWPRTGRRSGRRRVRTASKERYVARAARGRALDRAIDVRPGVTISSGATS